MAWASKPKTLKSHQGPLKILFWMPRDSWRFASCNLFPSLFYMFTCTCMYCVSNGCSDIDGYICLVCLNYFVHLYKLFMYLDPLNFGWTLQYLRSSAHGPLINFDHWALWSMKYESVQWLSRDVIAIACLILPTEERLIALSFFWFCGIFNCLNWLRIGWDAACKDTDQCPC